MMSACVMRPYVMCFQRHAWHQSRLASLLHAYDAQPGVIVDRIPASDRHHTLIRAIPHVNTTKHTHDTSDADAMQSPQARARASIRARFSKPVMVKQIARTQGKRGQTTRRVMREEVKEHEGDEEEKQADAEEAERKAKETEAFQESLRV